MITLTNQTTEIPIDHPRTWTPSTLTAVGLTITAVDGTELQAATPAGFYTPTTLDADASRYANTITLAATAGDLEPGDLIRLSGIAGYEDHFVKGYSTVSKIATLEQHIDRDFEDGADVYRLSSIATVDLSDTDTYPPGLQVVLLWTPTGAGAPITQRAEIEAAGQIDVAAFTKDFSSLFPRAYINLKSPADRLGIIIRLAQDELRLTLASRGLDIARVVDQRLLTPPLMVLVARHWALNGDKALIDERMVLDKEYSAAVERLCQLPIWVDLDGDNIQDTDETQSHPVYFERVW